MRLARHGLPGHESPVAMGEDGLWRDLRSITQDINGELLHGGLARLDWLYCRLSRTSKGSAHRSQASARSSASG